MDLVRFGQKLKAARERARLTQKALAGKATATGIKTSDKYIGLLENATLHESTGEPRRPSIELVRFVARELKQSETEFLDLAGYGITTDVGERKIVEYYRAMSPEARRKGVELFKKLANGEGISGGKNDK